MVSLLNGLSALGSGVANYAGTAGLEAQRADMQQQALRLADQLATTREQNVTQPFQASQAAAQQASTEKIAAGTNATSIATANIAANADAELRAAQAKEADARTALTTAQTAKVDAVTGLQKQIADEQAKPAPDVNKIKSLTGQVVAYGTDAQSQGAIMASLASQAASSQAEVARLSQQRDAELNTLSTIQFDNDLKAQKQAVVDGLTQQLNAAKSRADYFSNQAMAMTASRANLEPPPSSTSVAPGASVGSPLAGPRASLVTGPPSAPTSTQAGAPTSDSQAAKQPATGQGAYTAPTRLPGDTPGTTDLDALKKARPDLNIDALKGVNPAVIPLVMQMVEGRAALPPSGSRSPDAMMQRTIANLVDPNLDEATSKARMAARVSFLSGKDADTDGAINTALGHVGNMYNAAVRLNNSNIPLVPTTASNFVLQHAFNDPRQNNLALIRNAVAGEMEKVYNGSGGNLAEVNAWKDSFPLNGSLDQQKEAMQTAVQLLESKLDAQATKFNTAMQTSANPINFLSPAAQTVFFGLSGKAPIPKTGFAPHDNPAMGYQLGNPPVANPQTNAPPPEAAPLPMPKTAADAVAGKVYDTARGPARWDGNQFMPVQ